MNKTDQQTICSLTLMFCKNQQFAINMISMKRNNIHDIYDMISMKRTGINDIYDEMKGYTLYPVQLSNIDLND